MMRNAVLLLMLMLVIVIENEGPMPRVQVQRGIWKRCHPEPRTLSGRGISHSRCGSRLLPCGIVLAERGPSPSSRLRMTILPHGGDHLELDRDRRRKCADLNRAARWIGLARPGEILGVKAIVD